MVAENIRGLGGVYGLISPTAYRSQERHAEIDKSGASAPLIGGEERLGTVVTLSPEAVALLHNGANTNQQGQDGKSSESKLPVEANLSEEERREVAELKKRDQEVRAHEAAHLAAGGNLVRSNAKYEYKIGPDGKRYAVGGEVSIDTSEGRTPEETLDKSERIRRAAMAPANPSAQDLRVAADAAAMAMRARQEIAQQKRLEQNYSLGVSLSTINYQV